MKSLKKRFLGIIKYGTTEILKLKFFWGSRIVFPFIIARSARHEGVSARELRDFFTGEEESVRKLVDLAFACDSSYMEHRGDEQFKKKVLEEYMREGKRNPEIVNFIDQNNLAGLVLDSSDLVSADQYAKVICHYAGNLGTGSVRMAERYIARKIQERSRHLGSENGAGKVVLGLSMYYLEALRPLQTVA
jgi:hypothetical protein